MNQPAPRAALLLALAALLLITTGEAFAVEPPARFILRDCEQVPGGIAITFDLENVSFASGLGLCDFHMEPSDTASCPVISAAAPPGWSAFVNSSTGDADWFANTPNDCRQAGETITGFVFTVDDAAHCCYDLFYTDGTGANFYAETFCIDCAPVPASRTSWGTIKALYR